MRTSLSTSCFLCALFATLSVLSSSILSAEEIESRVIINDCYERMAIGHRLSSKDVYNTTNSSSAVECKKVCTEEKLSCKSFSFGTDDKNETVCELNKNPIKETGDLKPIGTVPNENFDLYIKKLDCTIVIDDEKLPSPIKNPNPKPPNDSYGSSQQNKPVTVPGKPQDSVEHVQTVVSIATGPQKPVLHPTLNILVGEGPYGYARPPFRPPFLNHPYERPSQNPRPEYRPNDYEHPHPIGSGGYYEKPWRPSDYNDRPPIRPGGYDERPLMPERPWRPSSKPGAGYDDGSARPGGSDERPIRPSYEERPIRPSYEERPIRPSYEERPIRPSYDERPLRPSYEGRPDGYDERPPIPPPRPGGYEERPIKPEDKPSDYDQKPIRPANYDERPKPGGYEEKPTKPNEYDQKPIKPRPVPPSRPDDYDERPSRPQRPIGPPRPNYDQRPSLEYGYGRPPNSYNEIGPQRPYYNLYQSSGYYYPHYQDYFEPSYYDEDKFYRPIPERYGSYIPRPDDYDYYRPRPIKDYLFNQEIDRYDTKPQYIQDKPQSSKPDPDNPNTNHDYNHAISKPPKPSYPNKNEIQGTSTNKPKEPHPKPIVTQSIGPHGETITSIIQEWDKKVENNKCEYLIFVLLAQAY